MKNLLLIIYLTLFIFNSSFTQDTIWLINGKKYELTDYDIDQKLRKLFYFNKRGKEKFLYIDHIFSITKNDGKEQVYFTPRKIDTTFYTVENMRSYITGFDQAEQEYRTWAASGSGFIAGGISGYIITIPYYSLVTVTGYSTIFGLLKPSKKKIKKKHPEYADDHFFIEGYQESAIGKRTWNFAKGVLAGIIVGATTLIIVHNNQ